MNLEDMPNEVLLWRAILLALMSISAKRKGVQDEWIEEVFPATVTEINRRDWLSSKESKWVSKPS